MINKRIREKAAQIKLLILDVDGVLTDGKIWFTASGEALKCFHIHDGYGIKKLQKAGITVAIISSRGNKALISRLNELNIKHYYLDQENKLDCYLTLIEQLDINPEQVAYVGDDLPDLPIMQQVGLSIAVANAVPIIRKTADWHTQRSGGKGAVREVCDLILSKVTT